MSEILKNWEAIGAIVALLAVLGALANWLWQRFSSWSTTKQLLHIDHIFYDYLNAPDRCYRELILQRMKLTKQLHEGKLNPQIFTTLDQRISHYMSQLTFKELKVRYNLSPTFRKHLLDAFADNEITAAELFFLKNEIEKSDELSEEDKRKFVQDLEKFKREAVALQEMASLPDTAKTKTLFRRPGKKAWAALGVFFATSALIYVGSRDWSAPKGALRVGVIKYKGEDSIRETFQTFVGYIAGKLGREPVLEVVEYDQLAEPLASGEYDLGVFSPFAYIEAKRDHPDLEIFATHVADGREFFTGVILVRKESSIRSLHDLAGKKFLYVHAKSTSGYNYPRKYFEESGIKPGLGFFAFDFSGSHDKSIRKLFNGEVDAIATYLEALDDSNLGVGKSDFRIIYQSEPIPYNAYVFSPGLNDDMKGRIKDVMLKAGSDPSAREMFNNRLNIQEWKPAKDERYNSVRRYAEIKRTRPRIQIALGESDVFSDNSDTQELAYDQIYKEFHGSGRFEVVESDVEQSPDAIVRAKLYRLAEDEFYYSLGYWHLNARRATVEVKQEGRLVDVLGALPKELWEEVVRGMPIQADLLQDKNGWFVEYGENDGLDDAYIFEITWGDHVVTLSGSQISFENDVTFIAESDTSNFEYGSRVVIRYPPS